MSNINDRLKQFFHITDENPSEVERKCGLKSQTLRKAFDRDSNLQVDKIEAILSSYPDLSAEWLLRGCGDILKEDDDSKTRNSNNLYSILGDNNNSNEVLLSLINQLAEKDKQIEQLIAKIK